MAVIVVTGPLHLLRIWLLVRHVVPLRVAASSRRVTFGIWTLHLLAIEIVFDIHFPSWIFFLQFLDDVIGECLIALHRDEGIAEEVEPAASIISFNDS